MVMTRSRMVVLCTLILTGAHVNGFAQIRSELHATGLTLPVAFIQDPTNPAVQFVVQQGGLIRVVQNGNVLATPFLDVSGLISCCGEQGLFSLAFPPDSATSRRFYISYTDPSGNGVISRYKRSVGNPLVADTLTRFDLVWASIGNVPFIQRATGVCHATITVAIWRSVLMDTST